MRTRARHLHLPAYVILDYILGSRPHSCFVFLFFSLSLGAILGKDSHSLVTQPLNRNAGLNWATVSARVSGNAYTTTTTAFTRGVNADNKPYYARLLLSPLSTDNLTANISSASCVWVTAPSIMMVNGIFSSWSTSWLTLQTGSAFNSTLSVNFPSTDYTFPGAGRLHLLLGQVNARGSSSFSPAPLIPLLRASSSTLRTLLCARIALPALLLPVLLYSLVLASQCTRVLVP